jgi:hypothetical protein
MGLQHARQLAILIGGGPKSILECSSHLLALLVLDVSTDNRFTDSANGSRKITSAPETREPRTKFAKLLPQSVGRGSFEAIDDLGHAPGRIAFNKQVKVIRHDLKGVNRQTDPIRDFSDDRSQPFFDWTNKHGPTVLRAPDQVVLESENGTSVFGVPVGHSGDYTTARLLMQERISFGGGNSAVA